MTLYTSHPDVARLCLAAFPSYTGRKFKVCEFRGPMRLDSNWSGGSRNFWAILELATLKSAPIAENGTPWHPEIARAETLPPGFAVVEHTVFCGKDLGLTLHVGEDNLARLLPPAEEISWAQKVVLAATAGLKSSYGGIKDYRRHEAREDTGITDAEYLTAKSECQAKGWLNAAGAITNEGRNTIGTERLCNLARPGYNRWGFTPSVTSAPSVS